MRLILLLTVACTLHAFSPQTNNLHPPTLLSHLHSTLHDDTPTDPHTRQIRLQQPFTFLSLLLLTTSPAHAGVGSIIPFEVTRSEQFSGSLANSIVVLRLRATLRKSLGYYSSSSILVATAKPQDDLAQLLAKEFAKDEESLSIYQETAFRERLQEASVSKAILLYGQDVTIAPDGSVSEITGPSIASKEQELIKVLGGSATPIVLLGGITIHRTKSGGKDAGEDCFYPVSLQSVGGSAGVTDWFSPVFGDLPTPRQDRVLK